MMCNKKRKKIKIRIHKLKFARFILICALFTYLMIQLGSALTNNKEITVKIEVIDNDSIETCANVNNSSISTIDETPIEKINTYDKKPQGLENIYYDYIIEISNNEKVPLEIILAIITTENITYNADACYKNSNGTTDMGLCQINSAYVDYFAKTYNIENFDPFNEKHAITFVARHMKYLSDYGKIHFNLSEIDSYIFAAGAYNRGLSNECKYRNMYEYKEKFLMNYNNLI